MDRNQKTIAYVNQAIMLGWPRAAVDEWARQQEPPVSEAEVNAAYAACVEQWVTAANTPDRELYALHVQRREFLYRRAIQAGDDALAHKILVDQAKLQRQYRSEQAQAQKAETEASLIDQIRAKAQKPRLAAVGGHRHA